MKTLDKVSEFLWRIAVTVGTLALMGFVVLLCWDFGVKETIKACGGDASNISLSTAAFLGISLYVVGSFLKGYGGSGQPPTPQRISPEEEAAAREKLEKIFSNMPPRKLDV